MSEEYQTPYFTCFEFNPTSPGHEGDEWRGFRVREPIGTISQGEILTDGKIYKAYAEPFPGNLEDWEFYEADNFLDAVRYILFRDDDD